MRPAAPPMPDAERGSFLLRNRVYYPLLALLAGVHALGLTNRVFVGDSALYAVVARHMVERNDYLNLYVNGYDWLDKPHFQFWMAALFMKIFGVSGAAYKLSGLAFLGLTAFYTYRLGRYLLGAPTGRLAVLLLLAALHLILSGNDLRAEHYLMAVLAGSVYHLLRADDGFSYKHLLLSALLAACAVMTKGIFVLLTPAAVLLGRHLFAWKHLLKKRWLLWGLLVLAGIGPELYAVYVQFDLHPEKVVFGRTGVSGLRFFFWDSQFGRFFNTGPITGRGDPLFFLHTLLWAFAPWGIFFYFAVFQGIRNFSNTPLRTLLVGIGLPLLLFSLSRFQLPHYTNMLFPLMVLPVAGVLQHARLPRGVAGLQWLFMGLMVTLPPVTQAFVQPGHWAFFGLWAVLSAGLVVWLYGQGLGFNARLAALSAGLMGTLGLYLNTVFFPKILQYEGDAQAALFVNENFPNEKLTLHSSHWLTEFYLKQPVYRADSLGQTPPGLFYGNATDLQRLQRQGRRFVVVRAFGHYHITLLTGPFLRPATRAATLDKNLLVRLE